MSIDPESFGKDRPLAERAAYRPQAPDANIPTGDRVCAICGAPAAGACVQCGSWYCVEHRGVEPLPDEPIGPEEGPRICWNCRLSGNAKAVLFWILVGTGCLVGLIYFFSLWI